MDSDSIEKLCSIMFVIQFLNAFIAS
jgi:hypothetical protein